MRRIIEFTFTHDVYSNQAIEARKMTIRTPFLKQLKHMDENLTHGVRNSVHTRSI